jgi:hypothetical protein
MILKNNKISSAIVWLGLASALVACSTPPVKTQIQLDLSHPGGIEFVLEGQSDKPSAKAMTEQIKQNLADWNYPFLPSSAGASRSSTHKLVAVIGAPEHSSTPTGFSFSMGNSDPRALDFQKADVVPINCKLSAISHPEQSAELNMGFADSAITRANPDEKALIDHVSTVCFNLLRELNWPIAKTADKPEAKANSWIPEIRIETQEANSTDSPTTAPSHTSAVESKPATTLDNNAPKATPAPEIESAKSGPITKEITKEGRKVFIIHNQGNPITFKFGHERK